MSWVTLLYVILALLLVAVNGFFVLAEFALVKVRATRIEELARQGNRRAKVARGMVEQLDSYLTATQLGITIASLGLGWVGEPAFASIVHAVTGRSDWWSPAASHTISAATAFVIITFLHILLGELAPKSVAIRRPDQSALAVAYPMLWAYWLFCLPMWVLNGASNWILRRLGLEAGHHEVAHSEQEMRMLLATAQTTRGFTLGRLMMLENIFDLGRQTVRDAMIPWERAMYLPLEADREEVLRQIRQHRYSRWPVIQAAGRKPVGYLLVKDLIAEPVTGDWTRLLRPLRTISPGDRLELILQQLQRDGTNMAVVMDRGRPIGLITLEDVLEEVVGRIEDEYPRLPRTFLKDSLLAGGVVLGITPADAYEAIAMLAAAIPTSSRPAGIDIAALAWAREREVATDVGHGVAIPHARCPGLSQPLIVFGRCTQGVIFSPKSTEPVRLLFLLVTPAERPNTQVFMLSQLASVAHSELVRARLSRALTPNDVLEIIDAADPAVTG